MAIRKSEGSETTRRQEKPIIHVKDQLKGNEGCCVDQEKEKSVSLTLRTRRTRGTWAFEYSLPRHQNTAESF